ncbi:MAG: hypothetical protein K2R93_08905 [Gemmatimonadaceae bacterium]|nr:hypothetical protein [Gemmatimonadaceae bacterium]
MTPATNATFSTGYTRLDTAATLATALFTLGTRELPGPAMVSPSVGDHFYIPNPRDFNGPEIVLPEYATYIRSRVDETGLGVSFARKIDTSDVVNELNSIARRLHSQTETLPADEQRILAENFWSLLA